VTAIDFIDVSAHQGAIDWAAVPVPAIIKATEGRTFTDPRFHENFVGASRAEKLIGVYHFLTSTSPGAAQARHFLDTVGGNPAPVWVLDWETDTTGTLPGVATAQEFISEFRALAPDCNLVLYGNDPRRGFAIRHRLPFWCAWYPASAQLDTVERSLRASGDWASLGYFSSASTSYGIFYSSALSGTGGWKTTGGEVAQPAYNIGMPNFPHFRLDPLDGSASDTLGYDGFRWSSAMDFGTRYRGRDKTMTVRVTSQQGYPAKVLSHAMRHGSTYSYTAPVFGEYLPKYGTSGDFTVSFDCSTLGEYRDTLDVFTNFGVWSLPISGKVIDPSTPIDSLAVGLYPNPTSGGLTLQLEMPATGTVTMYSAVGQLVRSWSLDNTAHLEMDLSEYAVGVYFLEIEMGGRKIRVEKVVKI